MVFSSLTFLYLFLPATAVLYYLCPGRLGRNAILLAASLLFYSWGEPVYLALLLAATAVAYLGGIGIESCRNHTAQRHAVFALSVGLVVLNLLVFKYLNFFWDNLNRVISTGHTIPTIALPIGISFYTFQILSYLIDLNFGRVKVQKSLFSLLLYVSFFPQLIAGPIVRYSTVEEEILHRRESVEDIASGLRRFIYGLSKKVILANSAAAVAELIYAGNTAIYGTTMYWTAALAYTMQIYFDFSGYSDMAIGLGRMFGFHFLENFNYPYISQSATEFWRRWHISLSSWFRDYIYIPLGGSRVDSLRWVRNVLIVWGLTGFWHGAAWNFILWGFYYAALLLIEKFFLHHILERIPRFFRWLYAFLIANIGWVLFNLTDTVQLAHALRTMFFWQATDFAQMIAANSSVVYAILCLPVCLLFSFPVFRLLPREDTAAGTVLHNILCFILLCVSIACIVSSEYNPFIYFRF